MKNFTVDGYVSSTVMRSLRIYFEPLIGFFGTKYIYRIKEGGDAEGGRNDNNQHQHFQGGSLGETSQVGGQEEGKQSAFPLELGPKENLYQEVFPVSEFSVPAVSPYVAPMGDAEEEMARIWQDLLGLERVGRYDNFLELGGDSLQCVRLVISIREQFQVDIPIRLIFEKPMFSDMSEWVFSNKSKILKSDEKAGTHII